MWGLKLLTEKTGLDVIASGGVSCMDDLTRLHESGIREHVKHCKKKISLPDAVARFEQGE